MLHPALSTFSMRQQIVSTDLTFSAGDNSRCSQRPAWWQGVRREQGVAVVEEHCRQCEEPS